MRNITKALTLVEKFIEEDGVINVVLTQAKGVDIYDNLFIVQGVRAAYHQHYVVDVSRGLVFQPHPAITKLITEDEMVRFAQEEWK